MVVCTATVVPAASASCPVTPTTIHPCSPGICAVSALPCQRRLSAGSVIPVSQVLTTAASLPCAQGSYNTTSPVLQCNPNLSTSTPQGLLTSTIVTGNPGLPTSTILPCNQGLSTSPVISCNPGISASTILPCQQRIITTSSILPCSPGVCPVTPASVLPGGVGICPVTNTPIVQSSTGMCPITSTLCSLVTVPAWKQSYGMEQVWQNEFRNLFLQYAPHMWMLFPVAQKPVGIWNANVDSAKVRFCCEDCGHGWTSMKGRVAFWFFLNLNTLEGAVCLKLYGQQCDRCKTGRYEPAMWYPEEVVKVLVNIYNRVGQVYYGFQQAPFHRSRRPGKPRTPHNSELCQACRDGVCAERR